MSRIHAPEIEDEPWFPVFMRDAMTAFLRESSERMGLFAEAAPVLRDVAARNGARHVVDLCSGGGGPVLSMLRALPDVDVVLTDLYPNARAFEAVEGRAAGRARGVRESVDATDVPAALDRDGVRTIFNAFHHFKPELGKRILADAAHKKRPIVVVEIVERHPLTMAVIAFVPFAVLVLAPFTRLTAATFLLTYVVPLIPLLTGWDGIASCLRAYSVDELHALVKDIDVDGYRFTVGQSRRRLPGLRTTWLVGEPVPNVP
jgi:hypothetical protein